MIDEIVHIADGFSVKDVGISTTKLIICWVVGLFGKRLNVLYLNLILIFRLVGFLYSPNVLQLIVLTSLIFIDCFSIVYHFLCSHQTILVLFLHLDCHLGKTINFFLLLGCHFVMLKILWLFDLLITMPFYTL